MKERRLVDIVGWKEVRYDSTSILFFDPGLDPNPKPVPKVQVQFSQANL